LLAVFPWLASLFHDVVAFVAVWFSCYTRGRCLLLSLSLFQLPPTLLFSYLTMLALCAAARWSARHAHA
jgi:hypothetical protein